MTSPGRWAEPDGRFSAAATRPVTGRPEALASTWAASPAWPVSPNAAIASAALPGSRPSRPGSLGLAAGLHRHGQDPGLGVS